MKIDDSGIWDGEVDQQYDAYLSGALNTFLRGNTVADFGCGWQGFYTESLKDSGINAVGFDGNPCTKLPLLIADLSRPLIINPVDWVICLEVGEHIPKERENALIHNCVSNSRKGVIISWAIPGQKGRGHVNCRPNDYIREKFALFNYKSDPKKAYDLRRASELPWFKNTIMVFRNNN